MRVYTCNAQVMRAYFQFLKTYHGDSVVCCNCQTALQFNSVADTCNPTRRTLIVLLAFCYVISALHASPGKLTSPLCIWHSSIIVCSVTQ